MTDEITITAPREQAEMALKVLKWLSVRIFRRGAVYWPAWRFAERLGRLYAHER